ncbi:MAG: cell wall anchor protein, partial [Streptococcaceae bacterium]|nr:cell wall anchor protein [Streptococcaceae bacterium]
MGVDGSTIPATAHTFNPGDSGRITDVGQTLSGIKLDMLYRSRPHKAAFTGEQNITGADGNSIVALYYGTNQLDLLYQVVLSGTVIEAPVLASFISTDIDNGQGVSTNLNNILTVTPSTTNLQDDGKIKYDTSNQNLNGASSLPYGGYLGVGFVPHFDYHFYSPAPAMSGTSLAYSAGVRYDLFGSALQAHLITQTRVHGQIFYYDNQNNQFHNSDPFICFPDTDVNIPMSHFDNYAQDSWEETGSSNSPVLNWHYTKLSTVTINFYGTNGVYLGSNSDTERAGTPYSFDAP